MLIRTVRFTPARMTLPRTGLTIHPGVESSLNLNSWTLSKSKNLSKNLTNRTLTYKGMSLIF